MFAEAARLPRAHLQHAERPVALAQGRNAGRRDDPVPGVDAGEVHPLGAAQVRDDDRSTAPERPAAGVAIFGAGDGAADHARLPADASPDDEVVRSRAVFENLAIRDAQTFGAEARPFGEHRVKVGAGKRCRSEVGQRRPLAQQALGFRARVAPARALGIVLQCNPFNRPWRNKHWRRHLPALPHDMG